jgi:hypothetical protein
MKNNANGTRQRSHLSEERLDIARIYVCDFYPKTSIDSVDNKEKRNFMREELRKAFAFHDSQNLRRIYTNKEYEKMSTRYLREALKERFPIRMAMRALRMRIRFLSLRFKAFF